MNRSPFKSARAVSTTVDTDPLTEALAELDQARTKCEHLRRLVSIGEEGASALSTAEWQLHQALRRAERLQQQHDYGNDAA